MLAAGERWLGVDRAAVFPQEWTTDVAFKKRHAQVVEGTAAGPGGVANRLQQIGVLQDFDCLAETELQLRSSGMAATSSAR